MEQFKPIIKSIVPSVLRSLVRKSYLSIKDRLPYNEKTLNLSYCGYQLFYNKGNSIVSRLSIEPVFEEDLCKSLVDEIRARGGNFLDIGANIGLITLYIASKLPTTNISSFEPGPTQYRYLKKTIENNDLDRQVRIYNIALSESKGKVKFFVHPRRDMAKDGLYDTGRGEKTVAIEVDCMRMDDWWSQNGKMKVGVMKIDTEGSELLVLRGAETLLKEQKPVLFLEIEKSNLKVYPYTAQDLVQFLNQLDYRLSTLRGQSVTIENIEEVMRSNETFVAK